MTRRHRTAGAARGPGLLAAGALLVAAACGDDGADARSGGDSGGGQDAPTTTVAPDPSLDDVELSLTEVAQFEEPTALTARPDDPDLFVAERAGRVHRVAVEGEGRDRTYTPGEEPILDISDEVVTDFEKGLLDIELSPGGERLYLHYSLAPDGDTRIVSYEYDETAGGDGQPAGEGEDGGSGVAGTVDPDSRREILALEQPYGNHNGGTITFGPDGFLYVGLGDGGDGDDPHGNGQDTGTLLGSILRIDPETPAEEGSDAPYVIPEDNPFADGSGGEPEIWLHGVRNPWRFSFDAVTGDLWIGDVGQDAWEEIDLLPAADGAGRGANLGWAEMEGTHPLGDGSNPDGAVLPVHEYPIPDDNCAAVTGGYVYSGRAIPDLDGAYLFGDYCTPGLRALTVTDGEVTGQTTFDDVEVEGLISFGQDNAGEIYLLSQGGTIHRLDP